MEGKKDKAKAVGNLVLQKVAVEIPSLPKELRVLESYLEVMSCNGLLEAPWAFQSETLVTELVGKPLNQYDGCIRAHPEAWTYAIWR